MSQSLADANAASLLSSGNADYVEALYQQYLTDPSSVAPEWEQYFAGLGRSAAGAPAPASAFDGDAHATPMHAETGAYVRLHGEHADVKQAAVSRLMVHYTNRGHLAAKIEPLGIFNRPRPRVLELQNIGLTDADLDTEFFTGSRSDWMPRFATLREILRRYEHVYCGSIGAEFAHVSDTDERMWLQETFQVGRMQAGFDADTRRGILVQLTAAEGLERYLHTRFVGQKRFSLEGGEAMIPLLDDLIQESGRGGVEEFIIGMAHRGRLNVLVNTLGKSPGQLFNEFEGKYEHLQGSGDVKYHKGFSSDLKTPGGNVHVSLAFNPSHLEIVNPVVEGSVRARQERRVASDGIPMEQAEDKVIPLLIHGDSAFSGQGVVMETLQLSQTRGYGTGGTIHIITNNQIGFTTSEPHDLRSTMYCSDVAKMIEAPILHVNGDDPEAVVFAGRMALKYRQRFNKDFVIDLVCYRRLGHNEADEPAATQPVMYKAIRAHLPVRKLYAEALQGAGVIAAGEAEKMVEQYRQALDEGRHQLHPSLGMIGNKYTVDWSRYAAVDSGDPVATAVEPNRLAALGRRIIAYPSGVSLHPRVAQIVVNRAKMLNGELPLDWGCAETLAYASLLDDGFSVRLSGQDCGRGTFFHRHAVLHDQNTGDCYIPLQHVKEHQPRFNVIDSVLSEEAVLGFEYGYSGTSPDCLVIWEGQFGDFVNGAQVLIDQFISSAESKWQRLSGLVLFLPHGYEGQGPEHSSARPERFLQLCAENNMQVCMPSTPAQMFHMLRRQMVRPLRKPLIVMTPKSLLRHELSVSPLSDLATGRFQRLIGETDEAIVAENVRRVVFCSGKVYFDLLKARRAAKQEDIALVRIEQLYPFPVEEYEATLARYAKARELVWCQEEPQNQGAWFQIRHRLQDLAGEGRPVYYAGRPPASAPATGLPKLHETEQNRLVQAALSAAASEPGMQGKKNPTMRKTS
jgi:2-oxoglutarate dehydrogenase E1 component